VAKKCVFKRIKSSRPVVDTLLAATAVVHDLAFVTRNTGDVKDIDLRLVNPWTK
jgi:toxin FitB